MRLVAGGLLLASAVAISAEAPCAASPPVADGESGDASASSRQTPPDSEGRLTSDASFFEAVLVHPGSDSSVRRAAAERLIRDRSPEAMQAIERVLRGKSAETLVAVVDSLDRAGARVPSLVEALVAAIASDRDFDRAAAVRVLASSDTRSTELLAAAALRGELSARGGAIAGLGELRSRDAIARLVGMLEVGRNEPPGIVQAICAALERSTGVALGTDPAAWRTWWEDSSKAALESGADAALRARVEAAERAVAEERRRGDRLAERLTDVYSQLFLRLTQKERMTRSGDLLTDSLPEVRAFAVTQIERLLRNGERPDDATLQAMTVLLDDPLPLLRSRGVRLLDDLAAPELAARIVERLPAERDASVSAAFLAALANRPSPEAFGAVVPLLSDPVLGEPACRALAELAGAKLLPVEAPARLLPVLRELLGTRPNGPAAQLLAILGDDADIARVTSLLDAAEPTVRRGAAEGLRQRGVRRPLLERSRDPAIFIPLMASLADEPRTLATLDQMIAAVPPGDGAAEFAAEWNSAVTRLLRDLPVAELPAADQVLERVSLCEVRTRIAGLSRFASAALGGLRRADVEVGLRRYVDLMVAQDRAREATDALAALQPKSGEPARDALFRIHLLSGEFREASELETTATAWLNVLESVIGDTIRARPIVEEIAIRFGVDPGYAEGESGAAGRAGTPMTPTERERFERLRKAIPTSSAAR
ncbi:MAG: hypothetical protein JNL80_14285 [Phycisphaerae bacterium]|nr:hypothetical protein [Phycisphaerae bacterium]